MQTEKIKINEKNISHHTLIEQVIENKVTVEQHINSQTAVKYLCVWDFNGTILDGNCSLGLWRDDIEVYEGLVRLCIEKGLSHVFSKEQFYMFYKEYQRMKLEKGGRFSSPYLSSVLYGNPEELLMGIAREYYDAKLFAYYNNYALEMINIFQSNGIENIIITDSADFLVKGAEATLGVPAGNIYGQRFKILDGIVSNKVIKPIVYGAGKIKILKSIIETFENESDADVIVLGGFGSDYIGDGPLLSWIKKKKSEVVEPVVAVINGGVPPEKYADYFITCNVDYMFE